MAYQTGSVQNTYELFDHFEAWLTGSGGPGWTHLATTTYDSANTGSTDARDKVFFSSGSDGSNSLTYRATFFNPVNMASSSYHVGISASIGTKDPAAVHNQFDYIVFQGYLNWNLGDTTPTGGTSSFGTLGSAMYQLPNRSTNPNNPNPISVFNYSSSAGIFNPMQQVDETMYTWDKLGEAYAGNNQAMFGWFDSVSRFYNAAGVWDGRRRSYYVSNLDQTDWDGYSSNQTTAGCYDLANGNNQGWFYTTDTGPYQAGVDGEANRTSAIVYDRDTQDEYLYYFSNVSPYWQKINLKTSTRTLLTAPNTFSTNQRPYACLWDGEDTIFKFGYSSQTTFEKYSISSNSWTTLTSLPSSVGVTSGDVCGGFPTYLSYIPHSASQTTLTSSVNTPTDVIYMADGGSTNCYRYDVSNNNWITDVAMPATFQSSYDSMWWDGEERMWYHDFSAATIYYRNISSSADYGTWTTYQTSFMNGNTPYSGSNSNCQMMPINGPCSKIRGQQQSFYESSATKINYWFQGDQDAINIVTETSGNYYWSHFGTYDSIVSTTTMKSTAAFSAGTTVNIPVQSTTGFVTGQEIIIADVSGSATVEKNQILEVVDSTNIKVTNLVNSFSSGSSIGTDPHQAITTGDSFLAVASLDGGGYRTDKMASMYKVVPAVPFQLMRASNTNAQGFYTPWPLIMYNNTRNLATYETKGMLKNCWVINSAGNYPALISGDTLNIAGVSYRVFPLEETTTLMGNSIDKLLLLIKTE